MHAHHTRVRVGLVNQISEPPVPEQGGWQTIIVLLPSPKGTMVLESPVLYREYL